MLLRFSFNGTLIVFVNFLQQPLPINSKTGAGFDDQSGALNMGQQTATSITLSNGLWMSTAPLLGAFVADQYVGRYKTIQWSNAIMILGCVILIISTLPWVIIHPQPALAPFLFGVILMGIGFGGIEPNLPTLVVEQIPNTELRIVVERRGQHVIIDPEATRSRVLLYFYSFANIGSIAGMLSMVYAEKYVGFWLSFTVPAAVFLICPLVLWSVRRSCTRTTPSISVVSKALKLCALAMEGQWSWNPILVYRNIHHPDFWTRVKPSRLATRPQWMNFEDPWVEEVSRGLRACRCFCWYPLYWPALRQMSSNLVSQAATLHLGTLPNDLLNNLNPLFCILLAPLYTHFIYSTLSSFNIAFSPIRRICAGFLCASLGIVISAIIQYSIPPTPGKLSVWVQLPIYLLLANSEILAVVTGIEYAYSQAPTNMRSLVMALFYFTGAGGSAVAQALVPLSEDPYLVWNYAAAAGLSFVGAVGVWWFNGRGVGM